MIKIPDNAKKVFEGIVFDVYQWPQKMFDGSTQTFEMLKRPDTVTVIAVLENKNIVVAYEEQPNRAPRHNLFGGRREHGEDAQHAAERELFEESGLKALEWELLRTDQPFMKIDWTIYTYIARGCKKRAQQKLDAGEKISLREVTFEEFVDIALEETFPDKELALDILRKARTGELAAFKQFLLK